MYGLYASIDICCNNGSSHVTSQKTAWSRELWALELYAVMHSYFTVCYRTSPFLWPSILMDHTESKRVSFSHSQSPLRTEKLPL